MGEIDGHKFPDLGARDAIDIADTVVNEFGGEANSEEAFASAIGHSSTTSGAYRSKLADVRKWGILESRGIEATELAFRLANPKTPEDEQEAIFEMYQNIQILNRLHDHLDGREPPSEFWRVVSELTGADPKSSREVADDLEALYQEMLSYEPEDSQGTEPEETGDTEAGTGEEQAPASPGGVPEEGIFLKIGEDTLNLSEISDTNLEMARLFIESKKREEAVAGGAETTMDDFIEE